MPEVQFREIRRNIGQILMPRLDFRISQDPMPQARELTQRFQVGGFILFGGEVNQVKAATEALQSLTDVPLFFACDAERGLGQIVHGGVRFPFAMSLGAIDDAELTYRQAAFIAAEMLAAGLNLIFAPVADVNSNPDNPIINVRSYGDDPQLVARMAHAFIRGCQDGGVLACAKHFPGHGGVAADSHVNLPVSAASLRDFMERDLHPFRRAAQAQAASIMIAHLAAPDIDPSALPATLSEAMVKNLLIGDMGFRGLVITDSLIMDALRGFGDEAALARRSIIAGCDIILDPKHPVALAEELLRMAQSGRIPPEDLQRAAQKILSAKAARLKSGLSTMPPSRDLGEGLVAEIARRSVCSLKGGTLRSRSVCVYLLDAAHSPEEGREASLAFARRLSDAGISAEGIFVSPDEAALFPVREDGRAIACIVRTHPAAWTGNSDLPRSYREFLLRASRLGGEKIFISLGSPYVVRRINPDDFDAVLFAFDSIPQCALTAADALLGRFTPSGRMPVRLAGV
ncbi:MAG: glycoside hydrolase family 3 protein [Deltaproteobacteria bacterium]